VRRVTDSVTLEAERNSDKVAQVIQWSQVAIGVLDKLNERRGGSRGWKSYNPK
jgi:uncharacterized protein YoxC